MSGWADNIFSNLPPGKPLPGSPYRPTPPPNTPMFPVNDARRLSPAEALSQFIRGKATRSNSAPGYSEPWLFLQRSIVIALALALSGCERLVGALVEPNGAVVEPNGAVVEPNGEVIEPSGAVIEPNGVVIEPPQHDEAIETVIKGLAEAQQVRALTRQLAR